MIDVSGLTGTTFHSSRTANVLTAGQIDQVEFADLHQFLTVVCILFDVDCNGEDGMRAARVSIHQRGGCLALEGALG